MGHAPVASDLRIRRDRLENGPAGASDPSRRAAFRRRLCAALAASAALSGYTLADEAPAQRASELPPTIRDALAGVRDFVLNIDQPGVLAVFEFVKRGREPPGASERPIEIADWHDFLERPSDLRGRVVVVEGVVGRNKDPYTLASRPDLGLFGQIELHRPNQPLTCTIVCTTDTGAIPVQATARFRGFFVMVRNYRGVSGREQPAALIVTTGPERVTPPATAATGATPQWAYFAGAIVLGLVVTIVLLARTQRRAPHDISRLRAAHEAPVTLADDLAEWARREDRDERR